jgi:hypothetical protein
MKYEKPQLVCLPDAVTSVSSNPLMKPGGPSDAPQSQQTSSAYSSDE